VSTVTYKGDWKNAEPYGKGVLFYENGDIYEGEFIYSNIKLKNYALNSNNVLFRKNGKGTYSWMNNGYKYIGEFKDDKFDGYGTFNNYLNGDKYSGKYKDGKKNGFGIHKFVNGTKNEQYWENDELKSKNFFVFHLNSIKICCLGEYKGEFNSNDKKNGFGVHKFVNGTLREQYWKNGQLKSKH
jgi:hypothetical protein